MDFKLMSVLILSVAFHLIFFSYHTASFIQQTVVNSIKSQGSHTFEADGYVASCITYTVFALANWLAPSIIAITGLRYGMILGSLSYVIFSASFLYPTTHLFYGTAALIGLGAAVLWSSQGSYLSANSDAKTASRNSAIFWCLLQASVLFGNIFVYMMFNDQATISDETRILVYGVLTTFGAGGSLTLFLLRNRKSSQTETSSHSSSALEQFSAAFQLAKTPNILLLSFTFMLTGLLQTFFSGIYGTAIGATSQFGLDAKKLIGLAGIFLGLGEILGGSIFGLMGSRLKFRRDFIFLLGYLVTVPALAMAFINIPADASLSDRAKLDPIIEPRVWLAMLTSLLIGFGDACFNTQLYSHLMSAYVSEQSVGAFALFKFVQSLGTAAAFLYSTVLNIHHQLYILFVMAVSALITFYLAERRLRFNGKLDKNQNDTVADCRELSKQSLAS